MILLAIDTASALCAACVYDSVARKVFGRAVLDLGKGHAEHLIGVVHDAMAQADVDFSALERIAVAVGPGSFTGVRVGVSAARGFAMALKIPAVGVTTLEAVAAEARETFGARNVMAVLDGGRGEIHAAVYDEAGREIMAPMAMTLADAARMALKHSALLAGSAAAAVAKEAGPEPRVGPERATTDIRIYAELGAAKQPGEKPKPLYLREADAKPQAGFVLPRIRS
ncbi:tRNA (adenosine(37)-N6)-threonylcarbamoyltransferase complex dimerization subunit type 1 TsaB [Mesorhizobium sp. KR9-304]|uniref:tRNA (adenosine(37)-N6)-threonylcarbamoyltransferase complex dimerization subunit type 1 TsaB n=1 Tax=Mesorhizobium sp. KR9-304 TaxID=3156614 RepID=UPI0032B3797D